MVVEGASGEPYAEFVRRELAAPLGLRHATYCPSHPTGAEWASGYVTRDHDSIVPAGYHTEMCAHE